MTGKNDSPFIHPRTRSDVFGAAISSRKFPALKEVVGSNSPKFKPLRICILTQDFVGPVKNGGIGTAYTYAARSLASAGHEVTVLYTINSCVDKTLGYWSDYYRELGINFVASGEPEVSIQKGPTAGGMHTPYRAYEWLKKRDGDFDIVHASEWCANAYLCLQAKQTGLHFQGTKFVIKCSSPTLWNHIGNAQPIADIKTLTTMFMERRSVEMADYVICGSQYLLNWMEDQGYDLPEGVTYVQPNIFPVEDLVARKFNQLDNVKELVFFGRLEPRKGIHFFIDALIQLKARGVFNENADIPQITFLGKPRAGFNFKKQLARLESQLEIKATVLSDKHQQEALAYLSEEGSGRVAVMPSLMDNSPFGVYECLSLGIPFITSDAGGGHELISSEDKVDVLFSPTPSSLSSCIEKILTKGCVVATPSFDFSQNIADWMQWHLWAADQEGLPPVDEVENKSPLVTVCMAHHNRGPLLNNAIESIQAQSYENVEIVIVDDGSTDDAAIAILDEIENRQYRFPVRVVRQRNKYLGAVRNKGISKANGEFILFMDDDNEAKPSEIETFVRVAKFSKAEIMTCWSDSFSSERPIASNGNNRRIVFHGENLAMALVRNPYGDSNCFAKKDALLKLGGFSEHYKVGLDDSEFFTRAILSGMKVLLVPEALYWYRINEVRMRHNQYNLYAGRVRMSDPYVQGLHPDLANVVRYAQGMGFIHGPWIKKKAKNADNVATSDVRLPNKVVSIGRKLVNRFPSLYPLARYVYGKLR